MIPNDPLPEAPPAPSPQAPAPSPTFWNYSDLLLFIGLALPSLVIAIVLVRVLAHFTQLGLAAQLLLAQMIWYLLAFGALDALFYVRYQEPFWRSLGWKPLAASPTTASLLGGPVLALVLGYLGYALHTPEIELPFQQMLKGRATIILLGLLVVVLGPLCEELAFRGFLMPLLMRTLGVAAGIILTGILFGCAHGYEYEWSWRHMLLISGAGCVFGWARYKTRSTASAVFMHSTFNLTQFAAFLIQARTI